jgi:phage terminase large subunit-like protein
MVEHRRSGLKKVLGPAVAQWNRSIGELYVANGSKVYCDGADDGGLRIQGKELRGAWADEIGLWKASTTKKGETKGGMQAWKESLIFAVREAPALIVATGTPKGNVGVVRLLREEPDGRVVFTFPSLDDNRHNLEEAIVAEWEALYGGTRLGQQELEGKVLEDVEGALWTLQLIEDGRWEEVRDRILGTIGQRTVVAIDPATTSNPNSDETGIVAATRIPAGADILKPLDEKVRRYDHGFVLADRSGRYSPTGWAEAAIGLYRELGADRIVAENNQGGEMVETILRQVDPNIPYSPVWASKGKEARAEPIASLYEQGRVHHMGVFPLMEAEQTSWVPGSGESPNRLDAVVWALTELFGSNVPQPTVIARDSGPSEDPTAEIMNARW